MNDEQVVQEKDVEVPAEVTILETPEVPAENPQPEPEKTEEEKAAEKFLDTLAEKKAKLYRQIAGKSKVEKSLAFIGTQNSLSSGGESRVGVTRKDKSLDKKARKQSKKSRKINRGK